MRRALAIRSCVDRVLEVFSFCFSSQKTGSFSYSYPMLAPCFLLPSFLAMNDRLFETANWIVAGLAILLGTLFLLVVVRLVKRTSRRHLAAHTPSNPASSNEHQFMLATFQG